MGSSLYIGLDVGGSSAVEPNIDTVERNMRMAYETLFYTISPAQ